MHKLYAQAQAEMVFSNNTKYGINCIGPTHYLPENVLHIFP